MLPLLLAGAGLVKGALDAKAQRDAEKRNMMANATAMEMSPWTGMKPGMVGASGGPGQLGGALAGGLQGGLTGAMFEGQFKGAPEAPVATPAVQQNSPWPQMASYQNPNFYQPGMMRPTR